MNPIDPPISKRIGNAITFIDALSEEDEETDKEFNWPDDSSTSEVTILLQILQRVPQKSM